MWFTTWEGGLDSASQMPLCVPGEGVALGGAVLCTKVQQSLCWVVVIVTVKVTVPSSMPRPAPELWITFLVPALHTPSDTRLRPLHGAPEVSVRQSEEGDARATSLDFSYWSLAS